MTRRSGVQLAAAAPDPHEDRAVPRNMRAEGVRVFAEVPPQPEVPDGLWALKAKRIPQRGHFRAYATPAFSYLCGGCARGLGASRAVAVKPGAGSTTTMSAWSRASNVFTSAPA